MLKHPNLVAVRTHSVECDARSDHEGECQRPCRTFSGMDPTHSLRREADFWFAGDGILHALRILRMGIWLQESLGANQV